MSEEGRVDGAMNVTKDSDCLWCDDVCYDQRVVNGTGDCDRFGRNVYGSKAAAAVFTILSPVGIFGHIVLFVTIWKRFRDEGKILLLGASFVPTFLQCLYFFPTHAHIWITGKRALPGEWGAPQKAVSKA